MNFIDSMVGYFSPESGLKRARARMMMDVVRKYDGASKGGHRFKKWNAPRSAANVAVAGGMLTLRDRARDLERNSPIGKAIIEVIATEVVGEGIIPQAKGNDRLFAGSVGRAQKFDDLFILWGDSREIDADGRLDFYGLQDLVVRSVVRDGEVFIRKRKRKSRDRLSVPVQIQILEADFCDHTKNETLSNGGKVVMGVEFDAIGRRRGYWMFKEHPNDIYVMRNNTKSEFIPADEIEHIYRVDRAGQVRGVTWFAPIMTKIKDLDDTFDFELVRRKVATCFAGFIRTTNPEEFDTSTVEGAKKVELSSHIEPGTVEVLPEGKEISFPSPPDASGFSDAVREQLRLIAKGVGISYEALTGDMTGVNFSSGRMGRLQFQRNIRKWRSQLIVPQFCIPVCQSFMDAAEIAQGFDQEGVDFVHTPPKVEFIDPATEIRAAKEMVRAGFSSLSEQVREFGRDPEKVFQEISEDNKTLDKLNLIVDTDPRKVSASGNPAPQDNGGQEKEIPNKE